MRLNEFKERLKLDLTDRIIDLMIEFAKTPKKYYVILADLDCNIYDWKYDCYFLNLDIENKTLMWSSKIDGSNYQTKFTLSEIAEFGLPEGMYEVEEVE